MKPVTVVTTEHIDTLAPQFFGLQTVFEGRLLDCNPSTVWIEILQGAAKVRKNGAAKKPPNTLPIFSLSVFHEQKVLVLSNKQVQVSLICGEKETQREGDRQRDRESERGS